MSVLKEKRTVSKAEYVNTANQIYVETVGFLTRLSAIIYPPPGLLREIGLLFADRPYIST